MVDFSAMIDYQAGTEFWASRYPQVRKVVACGLMVHSAICAKATKIHLTVDSSMTHYGRFQTQFPKSPPVKALPCTTPESSFQSENLITIRIQGVSDIHAS